MTKRTCTALLALAVLLLAAAPSQAAGLSFGDPAGDALDGRKSMDIVKVGYDVRQMNRGGPPSLVIELTLAGPPETQLASYGVEGDAGPCFIDAGFRPGTVFATAVGSGAASFFIGCEGEDPELVDAKSLIKGNMITLSIALDSLPKAARQAGVLENLYAFTQTSEPVTGIFGNGDQDLGGPGVLPTDSAKTDKKFKFA